MKSIIQTENCCFLCGRTTNLETHHIFGGVANRKISEREGLKVRLCADCHRGTEGAQYDSEKNLYLKQVAQMAYEQTHTRQQWMMLIRKNYLDMKEG